MNDHTKKTSTARQSNKKTAHADPEVLSPDEVIEKPQEDIRISPRELAQDPKGAIHKASKTKGPIIIGGTATIGAVVGSVLPGIGTMIGAGLGGIVGSTIVVAKGIKNKLNGTEKETPANLQKEIKSKKTPLLKPNKKKK